MFHNSELAESSFGTSCLAKHLPDAASGSEHGRMIPIENDTHPPSYKYKWFVGILILQKGP